MVLTHEKLRLPLNFVARLELVPSQARRGLVSPSPRQAAPGFEGRLCLHLANLGGTNVVLEPLEPLCAVELHRIDHAATKAYDGPDQNLDHLSIDVVGYVAAAWAPDITDQPSYSRPAAPPNQPEAAFLEEKRAFARLKPGLVEKYPGRYIAVHRGEVVAVADTTVDAASEAYAKVGYAPLYIGLAADEQEVARIPSPRRSAPQTWSTSTISGTTRLRQ